MIDYERLWRCLAESGLASWREPLEPAIRERFTSAGHGDLPGWRDALETPNVTAELVRRGYSAEDIGKIWGGNVLRVWREVESVAASR